MVAQSQVEVHAYSKRKLLELFRRKSQASAALVSSKVHSDYFHNYLSSLQAATIVVENDYTDTFYLADYVGYYARCFPQYSRRCSRLHFFKRSFTATEFVSLLRGETNGIKKRDLQTSYLGFIVVRPLPETFIGRTCLKTYAWAQTRRFPIARNYTAHLYGIDLDVHSLAFQEQDNAAGKCGTAALWSVLNGTGRLFQHTIPAPFEITKLAASNSPGHQRVFPNSGLSESQVAQAIRAVGLEPTSIEVRDNYVTKATLYAYLSAKIPVLMFGGSFDESQLARGDDGILRAPSDHENHAIAATGFRLDTEAVPYDEGFLLRSSRLSQLYAHDDGIGPFARMPFDSDALVFSDGGESDYLSIPFSRGGKDRTDIFVPYLLMVPLPTTIRVPFETILDAIIDLDLMLENIRVGAKLSLPTRIEWDISLCSLNSFRSMVAAETKVVSSVRLSALTQSLPKYMWKATAFSDNEPIFHILFDTTDLDQGDLVIGLVPHDHSVIPELRREADTYIRSANYRRQQLETVGKIWRYLARAKF